MNISLLNLVVASSVGGPYLATSSRNLGLSLTVRNGHFARFFNSFIYSSRLLGGYVSASSFSLFQDSAIKVDSEGLGPEVQGQNFSETLSLSGGNSFTVTGCTFSGCQAQGRGGGLCVAVENAEGSLNVEKSSFFNCSAKTTGGAIDSRVGDADWQGFISVQTCCFVQCTAGGENEVGYVASGNAKTFNFGDASVVDCAADNAWGFEVYVFSNQGKYENVNLSNTVDNVRSLGAFRVKYIHSPGVTVKYHHASGFKCSYLYDFQIEYNEGTDVTVSNIDVVNFTFSNVGVHNDENARAAIFWAISLAGGENNLLKVENCNAFDVTKAEMDGRFAMGFWAARVEASNCFSDVEYGGATYSTKTDTYTPNTLTMENVAYCYYGPDEPEGISETPSESEVIDSDEPALESDSDEPALESDSDEPTTESDDTKEEGGGDGDEDSDKDDKPLGPGAIAGIVIGVILVIAIIGILVFFLVFRRRRSDSQGSSEGIGNEMESETTTTETRDQWGSVDLVTAGAPPSRIFGEDNMSDPFDRIEEENA